MFKARHSVLKKILSIIEGLGAKPPPGNYAYAINCLCALKADRSEPAEPTTGNHIGNYYEPKDGAKTKTDRPIPRRNGMACTKK